MDSLLSRPDLPAAVRQDIAAALVPFEPVPDALVSDADFETASREPRAAVYNELISLYRLRYRMALEEQKYDTAMIFLNKIIELDPVNVEAYGNVMPLNQLATVSVPEPRLISVTVWDRAMAKAVDKAMTISGIELVEKQKEAR